MSGLATPLLVAVFAGAAAAIWVAGTRLASTTDALDTRLGLGSALGGLILLAVATNLPEVAITVSAAVAGDLSLAVGNILGGIAIQTVVLALLDAGTRRGRPLTHLAGSLVLVLEATTVIAVLALVLMSSHLPASTNVLGASPGSIAIVAIWIGALLIINRAQHRIPWQIPAEADPGRSRPAKRAGHGPQPMPGHGTRTVALLFGAAALVTLAGGVAIEESGGALASRLGLSGAVFGATILAAATALPEISTGLASVKLGDHQLAFSDIFGGNAFLPVLFLVADVIAGTPSLPAARDSDLWLAGLGIVLTGVYVAGLILRPERKHARMGVDSIAVVALYVLGIAGLLLVG